MYIVPRREPPAAIRAASPPEEPPGVRFLHQGFFVEPHIGLLHPKLSKQQNIYCIETYLSSQTAFVQLP